jgi:GNAT superfamily N-acetyltransferase
LPKFLDQKPINPLNFFIERGGKVIETEHGWCNYYVNSNHVYLENMYIYPEFRKDQLGTSLLMRLETQIKEIEGKSLYFTSISRTIGSENVEKTLMICLKRGFKFYSSDDNAIILRKEL